MSIVKKIFIVLAIIPLLLILVFAGVIWRGESAMSALVQELEFERFTHLPTDFEVLLDRRLFLFSKFC